MMVTTKKKEILFCKFYSFLVNKIVSDAVAFILRKSGIFSLFFSFYIISFYDDVYVNQFMFIIDKKEEKRKERGKSEEENWKLLVQRQSLFSCEQKKNK